MASMTISMEPLSPESMVVSQEQIEPTPEPEVEEPQVEEAVQCVEPLANEVDEERQYRAGLLDAALKLRFGKNRTGQTTLAVQWVTSSEPVMAFLRGFYGTTSLLIKTKARGEGAPPQTTCIAHFDELSERRAIKLVASRGLINKDTALAVYSCLKGKISPEAAERRIAEITAAPVETKELCRVLKPKNSSKAAGAKRSLSEAMDSAAADTASPPKVKTKTDFEATDSEVNKVAPYLTPSFTAGLLDILGKWRVATVADPVADTKRRQGMVAIDLARAPGALRVATGIKKFLGAGKVSGGRVRLVFSTVKELSTLKDRLGDEIRFGPVEELVLGN